MSERDTAHSKVYSAALLLTTAACGIFVIVFLVTGLTHRASGAGFYEEFRTTYGSQDTKPSFYGYLATMLFLATLALTGTANLVARRVKFAPFPRFVHFDALIAKIEPNRYILKLLSWAAIALILIRSAVLVDRSLSNLFSAAFINASDPHLFAVFVSAGEAIARGTQDQITNAYGFLLPLFYAALKLGGATMGFAGSFALVYCFNIIFILIWSLSIYLLSRRLEVPLFASIVFAFFIIGPAAKLLTYDGSMVVNPNLSGYRFISFGFVFLYSLLGSEHSITKKVFCCAILSSISLLISPDTGVIAVFAFIGIVLLQDVVDLSALRRGGIFLCAHLLAVGALYVASSQIFHIDLMGSTLQSASAGGNGYGGLPIYWNDPNWIVAAAVIFAFIYLSSRARSERLPPEMQTAAILSGLTLLWYVYYLYRPSDLYWIYTATFYPLVIVLWAEARRLDNRLVKGLLIIALAIVTASSIRLTIDQAEFDATANAFEDDRPQDHFDGVRTDAAWAETMRVRESYLKQATLDNSSVLPITALATASVWIAPHTRLPYETLFVFNSPLRVAEWRAKLCANPPSAILFDGPLMPSFLRVISNVTKKHLTESIAGFYKPAEKTDVVEVWRLNDNWRAACQG